MSEDLRVKIREVGCREGFQILQAVVPTAQKAVLIRLLVESGLQEMEVVSFVRPDMVPQMADAEELVKKLPLNTKVSFTGLYLNPKGFARAMRNPQLTTRAWIPIALSETFLKRNSNQTFVDLFESIPKWEEEFSKGKKKLHGIMVSAAFGCNFEGPHVRTQLSGILEKARAKLTHLPQEVCLADTMGWGTPRLVKEGIRAARAVFPESEVALHLHDTRGTGIANAYAGLEEGVRLFEASIGGIGGCPFTRGAAGNIATEELVFLLEESGIPTGIDPERLFEAMTYLNSILPDIVSSKWFRARKAVGPM
jgi:hydroxymethylglutaryl-CoA lyase